MAESSSPFALSPALCSQVFIPPRLSSFSPERLEFEPTATLAKEAHASFGEEQPLSLCSELWEEAEGDSFGCSMASLQTLDAEYAMLVPTEEVEWRTAGEPENCVSLGFSMLSSACDLAISDDSCMLAEEEIKFIESHLCEVHVEDGYCYGFLEGTEQQKESFLEQFTLLSSTQFVRSRADIKEKTHKTKSQTAQPLFEHKCGKLPISCLSHPFLVLSMETRNCVHGPVADSRGGRTSTKWSGIQRTRKLDCPASLQVRAISLFTDYTLASQYSSTKALRNAKTAILKQLKHDIQIGKELNTTTRYYFRLALSTCHRSHPVGMETVTARHQSVNREQNLCDFEGMFEQ